jgi:CO/xanthine dehydrogenase FAD-binding subunit
LPPLSSRRGRGEVKMARRVGCGGPHPDPLPASRGNPNEGHDAAHIDEAAAAAYGCARPIDDVRASAEYRQAMVVNITGGQSNTF